MESFSVVIPIRGTENEVSLIPKTLPAYIVLNPDEILLCVDEPVSDKLKQTIFEVANKSQFKKVDVVEVSVGDNWGDQQMKARRTGFIMARNDKILTGDIDIVPNSNVFKALSLVGKDNVGMVSLTKLRKPHNLLGVYRFFGENFLRLLVHRIAKFGGKSVAATSFSGLYALWKPFWLDTDPEDEAKQYSMVKRRMRDRKPLRLKDFLQTGEDTYRRDHMLTKHRVVYLPDIGAKVLTDPLEDQPLIQYTRGIYFAFKGRGILAALARAILRGQPHYLRGHLMAKNINRKRVK